MADNLDLLKKHHLKVTPARKFLLETIEKEKTPADAQHLIEHMQEELGVDRVTVFRMLNTFTRLGILTKLEFGEGKARYELNSEDHHHFLCENCGKVIDIPDTMVPKLQEELEKKYKFIIKRHSLEFFGLCE